MPCWRMALHECDHVGADSVYYSDAVAASSLVEEVDQAGRVMIFK